MSEQMNNNAPEEKVLTEQLPGYEVYKQKVKYRLIPFIW